MKMRHLALALIVLLFTATSCGKAQVVVQTWVDPCTNTVQTVVFPLNNIGVTVMYRGASKVFTSQQARAGELQAWIAQVTASIPCPITTNPVVTQTVTQTAAQAATSAATSTPAAPAAPAPSSSSSSSPASSSGSSSSSSSSETKTETGSNSETK